MDNSKKFRKRLIINFLISLLFVILPIIVVMAFSSEVFFEEVMQYEYNNNIESLDKSKRVVESVLDNINISMGDMWEELEMQYYVKQKEVKEDDVLSKQMLSTLKVVVLSENYINRMQLYSKESGVLIDTNEGFLRNDNDTKFWNVVYEWFNAVSYNETALNVVGSGNRLWKVEPLLSNGNSIGYLVCEINVEKLVEYLVLQDDSFYGKDLFILNDYGSIIYINKEGNKLYKNIVEQMEWSYAILSLENNDIKPMQILNHDVLITRMGSDDGELIFATVDHSNITTKIMNKVKKIIQTVFIYIIILCIISVIIITLVTYSPVSHIVRNVSDAPLNGKKKRRKSKFQKYFFDETDYIINLFQRLSKENSDTKKEMAERMQSLKELQIKTLQNQTDPHFLYNSLDTIRWISVEEFGINNNTGKMLEELASLYRQYCKTDSMVITVKEEIEMLNKYMDIINVRFENKIEYEVDVPDELLDEYCLNMCLQPIVENSIKHGLRSRGYVGKIKVSLKKKDENVREFCISDNGVGMKQEEIHTKNNELQEIKKQASEHIGISNVNQRIKLIYGDDYGIRLSASKEYATGLDVYINFRI